MNTELKIINDELEIEKAKKIYIEAFNDSDEFTNFFYNEYKTYCTYYGGYINNELVFITTIIKKRIHINDENEFANFIVGVATKKEYERMIPFSKKPHTVDTVLQFLETNIPQYNQKRHCLDFDIVAYFYCYALISLSDYRQEDCQKQLWYAVDDFMERDRNMAMVLLRNMKVLEPIRPFLTPMKEKLEKATES